MPTGWTGKELIKLAVNLITGLGTVAVVIVVYYMSNTANGISKGALDATNRAVEVAREADSLTEIGIKNTLRVSETDLRPYVWFESLTPQVPTVGTFAPKLVLKNFGRTPAFNLNVVWTQHNDTSINIRDPITGQGMNRIGCPILPPGAEQEMEVSTKKNLITEGWLAGIASGRINMFFAVKIEYDQRVGQNQIPHVTTFCLCYDPSVRAFIFYPKYNSDR